MEIKKNEVDQVGDNSIWMPELKRKKKKKKRENKPVVSGELSVLEQLQSGETLDLVDLAQFFLDGDID